MKALVTERVKTGIDGLDVLLNGGIPKNQVMLVSGTSGVGKTVLSSQFLYSGAALYKDNGVYLSFEEPEDIIKDNAMRFGWDFEKLEKLGKFTFIHYDPYNVEDVFNLLESTIKEKMAKRLVIDSISALGLYVRDKTEFRRLIFNLSLILRNLECTSLITSEILYGKKSISRYGVEEFVADSAIIMYYERMQSTFQRAIQVWKLRGSPHSQKIHPYEIKENGIVVYPEQEAFLK